MSTELIPIVFAFLTAILLLNNIIVNRKNKKKKTESWIYIIVWGIAIIHGGFISNNWGLSFVVFVFTFGGFIVGGLNNKENLRHFIYLFGPFFITYSFSILLGRLWYVLPIALIPPFAVVAGIALKKSYLHKKWRTTTFGFAILGLLLFSSGSFFMPNWISLTFVKNFKTNIPLPEEMLFCNLDGSEIMLKDLKNKIVILDFWSTSCGYCFEQFPRLDEAYKKLNVENVLLYSINIPIKRDTLGEVEKIIREEIMPFYKFPVLISNVGFNEFDHDLVNAFPKLLIIDKKGNLRFKGQLYTRRRDQVYNLYNMIAELKKEK